MTDRPTASTINDAELDALYDRIATLEHVAAGNKRHVQLIVPDLESAEAKLAAATDVIADHEGDDWAAHPATTALRAALAGPGPADTDITQPEPRTGLVVQPYRNDRGQHVWVFRCWGTDTCDGWLSLDHSSQESAERAQDRHIAEQHAGPTPPGSTVEQLPANLLALIRDRLPDYTSTACQTADTVACAACYPGSGVPRPQYDEIREHAERLHNRCRLNNKFTGQLCACGCHPTEEQAPAVGGGR